MRRAWCSCFGAAVATAAVLSGCTSPTLTGPRPWNLASSGGTSSAAAFSGSFTNPGGTQSAPADPFGKLPQPSTSTSGVTLATLLSAGKSVTNSLRIPSKVTPAADPVKLDNQPNDSTKVAAELHYHAGYFRETQNDFAKAGAHYQEVLNRLPHDVRALTGYGRIQDQLGNSVEAENYLRRACELAPQDPVPWNDLAQSHSRRNNLDVAIQCQQQAVLLQPMNAQYRGSLAKLLVDAGRREEAVQQLAAVHGDSSAHFQVGCLLHERRELELARQHLQRSLTLNPAFTPARQMLDRWQVSATGRWPAERQAVIARRLPLP